jgi:hypothetical protein
MHTKIADYLRETTNPKQGEGIQLYPLEISRALNLIPQGHSLESLLDDGYDVSSCCRTNYSFKVHWVDILITLIRSGSGDEAKFIITYDAPNNILIGITNTNANLESVSSAGGELPFALSVGSHTVDVIASSEQMRRLETRRDVFVKALIASVAPLFGSVSPSMAAPTAYTTNVQSGDRKTTTTSQGTSALTTPNDQDTRTDTTTEQSTDYKTDATADTRDDR